MHRRRFIAAAIAGLTVAPALSTLAQTPAAGFEALDVALVRYRSADDSGIRTMVARASLWEDEDEASAFQEYLAGRAGSDLPEGEFHESEPQEWTVPGPPENTMVTAMEWHTVIGFAAYRTEWVLCTMRRDTLLWDVWISGAERAQVRDYVRRLMTSLTCQDGPDCGTGEVEEFLPRPEDIPDGMEQVRGEVADDDLDFPVVPSISTPDSEGIPMTDGVRFTHLIHIDA
jgi:hypothetical protein